MYTDSCFKLTENLHDSSIVIVICQALVILFEFVCFYTICKIKQCLFIHTMSDNMHVSQFTLSAVCRLCKLFLVWQLVREPVIIAISIPFAILLRAMLEKIGERSVDISYPIVTTSLLISVILLATQISSQTNFSVWMLLSAFLVST